jgi:hypothetical protein
MSRPASARCRPEDDSVHRSAPESACRHRPKRRRSGRSGLIDKVADGSNLTFDPEMDSFCTQDALIVKVTTAVAGVVALAAAVAGTAGHDLSLADQVSIGVQVGALQSTLDVWRLTSTAPCRATPTRRSMVP